MPAGRRSGKTEHAKRYLVRAALSFTAHPDGLFVAAAPTRAQAKRIYWKDLKKLVPAWAQRKKPSETELTIYLLNGAELAVVGMDRPERVEGSPLDGIVLDEYANMKEKAWDENVRPALSTPGRPGWAWLIGVPEGRNHYYRTAQRALDPQREDWDVFTWPSADILDPAEVEAAREDLDPRTFRQEYEASFESFTGLAYYGYDRRIHSREILADQYDPELPLICTFDFNRRPGTAVISQEVDYWGTDERVASEGTITAAIGEVWIPDHSTTPRVCRALLKAWGFHPGEFHVYGDATGGSGGSAQTEGSDWELVVSELRPALQKRLRMRVATSNPTELARVNAMNSRLLASSGTVRLLVCPRDAPT